MFQLLSVNSANAAFCPQSIDPPAQPTARAHPLRPLQPADRKDLYLWVCYVIRFHNIKHPQDMGAREVEALLSYLANDERAETVLHSLPTHS
jgi:hypothetical protein